MEARETAVAAKTETSRGPLSEAATSAMDWARAADQRLRSVSALGLAEARLAALGTGTMVVFAVAAAVMALGAWGLAMALVVVVADSAGLAPWQTLLGLAAIHAIGAFVCWRRVVALTAYWEFTETRRQIDSLFGGDDADAR